MTKPLLAALAVFVVAGALAACREGDEVPRPKTAAGGTSHASAPK